MDDGGQRDHTRHRMDYYKGVHIPWNTMPQYQMNEANAIFMNKRIMHIIAEKDAAVEEMNKAIAEKNAALEERNEAFKQRDDAIAARDTAVRERDSSIAALRFQENSMNGILGYGIQRGTKRAHQPTNYYPAPAAEVPIASDEIVESRQAKRAKGKKNNVSPKVSKSLKKGNKKWHCGTSLLVHRKASAVLQMGERWVAVILLHNHPVIISTASDAKQATCTNGWAEDERKCLYQIAHSAGIGWP
ncbi:basic pentacysteine 5 [Actinidia rufa]|uniref:GAGA-binding transcriptional activator n=1 Tax=Actinidia rufa TaxID=165716 RepID=A0A7J0ETS7_9ERIC|nr:basic pentacysteine 5 [Actinidia rufa]